MAEATAMLRAAHQVLDADPKILPDPFALRLLGADTEQQIEADLERLQKSYMRGARTFAVMRSRFTEDQLIAAIDSGVRQYVILGAGLDTFAYRSSYSPDELRIFEVDHPDTQRWKLAQLSEAGVQRPPNVRYLPVDFETQSLAAGLETGGVDLSAPIFFSWLGVTYYLNMEAVDETFRLVGGLSSGSQLVFDFVLDDSVLSKDERAGVARISKTVKGYGEPWLSRFSPVGLEAILQYLGFGTTCYVNAEQAHAQYLKDRSDGLSIHSSMALMAATV